jgi:hypothetical protein
MLPGGNGEKVGAGRFERSDRSAQELRAMARVGVREDEEFPPMIAISMFCVRLFKEL